jgi:superkiller protein 3
VEALLRRRIPFYPSPYEEMAYIFLRANQLAAIIQHYRQVVERTPQDVAAWRFLGCAYGVQRQRKLAISAWQQVVALAPDDAEAYYQLGEATQQLGRREQARQALGKALGIDPRHMGAQQALARLDQEL